MHQSCVTRLGNSPLFSLVFPSGQTVGVWKETQATEIQWLPFLIGVLLILLLLGGIFYLLRVGQLQKWSKEGIGWSKSKLQVSKLSGEKKKLDKSRSGLVEELGAKIWELKIENPAYTQEWERLVAMEDQQKPIFDDIQRLEGEARRVKEQRDTLSEQLSRQSSGLQTQVQNLTARISILKGSQANVEKNFQSLQQRSGNLVAEIHGIQGKIAQMQTSNAPDKDQQVFSMNNTVATLNAEILSISNQMPGAQSELTRLRNEQAPLLAELDRVKTELEIAQDQLRQLIPPMDVQLSNLGTTIKAKQSDIASIKLAMQPIIAQLGPIAEQARPESVALSDLYARIDVEKSKLGSVTGQVDVTRSRIEATDKKSASYFYLFVVGSLILFVVAVWLIMFGL